MRYSGFISVALTLAGSLALSGCATGTGTAAATQANMRCPVGQTMTCEANKIGRIHHGTFRKNYDKCACVPETTRTLDSPVIPVIRQ